MHWDCYASDRLSILNLCFVAQVLSLAFFGESNNKNPLPWSRARGLDEIYFT